MTAQLGLLDAGPDEIDKALEDVRGGTSRLHETAMMIQGRLDEEPPTRPRPGSCSAASRTPRSPPNASGSCC